MSKEVAKNTPSNERKSIFSMASIASSFNSIFYNVVSRNNTYNLTYNINEQTNNSTPTEAQEDGVKETILEFVWKYLDLYDKLNCTLVCKRFNEFIFEMDGLRLYLDERWTDQITLPIFNRSYKTLFIKDHNFESFNLTLLRMLKKLSGSLIHLTLHRVKIDDITLNEFLNQLPLLESIELFERDKNFFHQSLNKSPQFPHLRSLKIDFKASIFNKFNSGQILDNFRSAPNVCSVSLCRLFVPTYELYDFLKQFKNNFESLTIIDCITDREVIENVNIFDCLLQLRKLSLINSFSLTKEVLTTKCIDWLTDFQIRDRYIDKEEVNLCLQNFYKLKEINEHKLLEYENGENKEAIVTNTKCPNSGNFITTFYHLHHCNDIHNPKNCEALALTYSEPERMNFNTYLSIQVRKNVNEFNNVFSETDLIDYC